MTKVRSASTCFLFRSVPGLTAPQTGKQPLGAKNGPCKQKEEQMASDITGGKKKGFLIQLLSNLYILKGADRVPQSTSIERGTTMQKVNVNTPITITGRHVEVTDAIRGIRNEKD